jgi:hypothetical protein
MTISEKRMAQIIMEETVPNRQRTKVGVDPEEDALRAALAREIKQMKADGIQVSIPVTQPDITEPEGDA